MTFTTFTLNAIAFMLLTALLLFALLIFICLFLHFLHPFRRTEWWD